MSSRINTNVSSLAAQRGLSKSQRTLSGTLQRLSSGLRINRGADDPAGLIASEGLRSEISGIGQAIDNSQRAGNVIATTEGALGEVNALLLSVKSLIVEAANTGALSREEIEANQLQVDSAIESITRISNTTTFAGLKLLDGSLDYVASGVATSAVSYLNVTSAHFGTQPTMPVELEVLTSARRAGLEFRTSAIAQSLTLEVAGNEGVDVVTFNSGATSEDVFTAVNRLSDATGVRAEYLNSGNLASGVRFTSTGWGSRQFVSVQARGGPFPTTDDAGAAKQRAEGRDAVAEVNGARAEGDGLDIKLNTANLDLELTLDDLFGAGATDFVIVEGGAMFQLGPKVQSQQQVNVGIGSVAASNLGDLKTGFLSDVVKGGGSSLERDPAAASRIVERALRQVATMRGRLGALEKNTLDTNVSSLGVALENVTAAESSIRDADFARETAEMTRGQILTQAGTSVLATANSTPQSVLALLQG